jgi:ABC-type antimicrobial peptide transport system permease subunit
MNISMKTGWRYIQKNKTSSFINIGGLAIGMAVALLIGLWVWDELQFDSYYENHRKIVQVMVIQTANGESYAGETITQPLVRALHNYPEEFKKVSAGSWDYDAVFTVGEKKLSSHCMWVEPDFPDIFTLKMIAGSRAALKDPSTVLISKSMAKSLFGNEDPMNKPIRYGENVNFKVGGVFEDMPRNTTFNEVRIFLPYENKEYSYMNTNTDWKDHNGRAWALLTDKMTAEKAFAKIRNLPTEHVKEWKEEGMVYPLDRVHLWGEFKNGVQAGGRIEYVWMFGIIGFFVLLLACINFMNLSTARSEKRAKEVGIRKTVGSLRGQLVRQFLSESILLTLGAFIISIALVQISIGHFNNIAAKDMEIPWSNPIFWLIAIAFSLFTGFISGSYPALYLSRFDPIKVLKGTLRVGPGASIPRKILVVTQFAVSVTLIIGTIVVFRQIQWAKNRPIGYDKNGLITVYINSEELRRDYTGLRQELLGTGVLSNMAESSQPITEFSNNNSLEWRGKPPGASMIFFRNVNVSFDFGRTIGWKISQGRDFNVEFATDSNGIILSEKAVDIMGIPHPVGETVKFFGTPYHVIGVVKDMVTNSPYENIEPSMFLGNGYLSVITLKLRSDMSIQKALSAIEPIFKRRNPGSPFLYQFNDENIARKFQAEQRIGHLAMIFAALAIFISCLGLFGLALFVAEQRIKEIGVRKVLGASLFRLWKLLTWDFVVLVVISFLIAIPLAYYIMSKWLLNYDYRTTLDWWIFASAAGSALVVTLLTVSYQSIRAALSNPVRNLRSE